ncbi:MAG: hypothetical protein ACTHL8_14320 [Burkholderiaceae bacterium]
MPSVRACRRSAALAALLAAAGLAAAAEAPRSSAIAAGEMPRAAVVEAADASRAAPAEAPREHARTDAVVECESAVNDSLRQLRGRGVQGVQFTADAQLVDGEAGQVDVKGAGRYRLGTATPVEFRYSCVFDRHTGLASGVVLHDAPGGSTAPLPVWRADLSRISPAACESAVADRLQRAYARASGITFDGGDRRLEPAGGDGSVLAGSGHLVRAPGMAPAWFRYRCQFDAAGRLTGATAGD